MRRARRSASTACRRSGRAGRLRRVPVGGQVVATAVGEPPGRVEGVSPGGTGRPPGRGTKAWSARLVRAAPYGRRSGAPAVVVPLEPRTGLHQTGLVGSTAYHPTSPPTTPPTEPPSVAAGPGRRRRCPSTGTPAGAPRGGRRDRGRSGADQVVVVDRPGRAHRHDHVVPGGVGELRGHARLVKLCSGTTTSPRCRSRARTDGPRSGRPARRGRAGRTVRAPWAPFRSDTNIFGWAVAASIDLEGSSLFPAGRGGITLPLIVRLRTKWPSPSTRGKPMKSSDVPALLEGFRSRNIDVIRVSFSDLIGVDRGRDVLLDELEPTLDHGIAFCRAVYHTTPMGDVVPVQGGMRPDSRTSAPYPDLDTLTDLPWEPGAAWCLGRHDRAGRRSRRRSRPARWPVGSPTKLGELGLGAIVGPELEFYLLRAGRPAPQGWRRYADAPGNVYVVGRKGDPRGILLTMLRYLRDAGLQRDGGQPRVLRRTVRDQPVPLRPARRRRPRVPDEVRGPGDRPPRGDAGDLHGQALQRRGRQRLPPPRLAGRRRAAPTSSATPTASDGLSDDRALRRSAACWPTHRRSRRCSTRRSTPTSGSAPTRWRRG